MTRSSTMTPESVGLAVEEIRFPAMGTQAHVVVTADTAAICATLLATARRRIEQLERRWSRFIATSEVSRLNRWPESPLTVSDDTFRLVRRAIEAWQLTDGRFDPTVLDAMLAAGYDRTFEEVVASDAEVVAGARAPGCAGIVLDPIGRTIWLAPGTGLDPGGIGKGLAGDIVVGELLADGARGACVNLGGDVRVEGVAPTEAGWQVGIDDPYRSDELLAVVGLEGGSVVTSTRLKRRWERGGRSYHHLVDPTTGLPADSGIDSVTVLAAEAWWAEAVAKAVFVAGADEAFALLDRFGATGLVVERPGVVMVHPAFVPYLA